MTESVTPNGDRFCEGEPYTQVTHSPLRCPRCGCTDREPFHNRITQDHRGELPDGYQYTRIVRSRTKCVECGQRYVVRTYERPATSETRTDSD